MIHHIERHINTLKEKPEHVRKKVSFVISLSVAGLIFVGWIASYGISSTPPSQGQVAAQPPFQSLTASVGDAFNYVKDLFKGSNKNEYTAPEIELTPGTR